MFNVAGKPFTGRRAEKRAREWAWCVARATGERVEIHEVVNGHTRPAGYAEPLTEGQVLDMEAVTMSQARALRRGE